MENRTLLTPQSVAAIIVSGLALVFIGLFGGGHLDVVALGTGLLLGAGLFQTLDDRRAAR